MKKLIAALSLVCLLATTSETASAQRRYRHRRHVTTTTTTYQTKHGWSRKGKDAAIGGVAGAAAGAVIGHGVKGAVVGGAAGATGGYLIGRHRDRKYGRKMDTHTVTTRTVTH